MKWWPREKRAVQKKAKEDPEKEERCIARMKKEQEAKRKGVELCATLIADINKKGCDHIPTFNVERLRALVQYEF